MRFQCSRVYYFMYEPLIIFLPLQLTHYCFACIPKSIKAQIKQIKRQMTDVIEIKALNTPQNWLTDMLGQNSTNMCISAALEEMQLLDKSSLVPLSQVRCYLIGSFRVVLWLTWAARNPTTLICDWWGHCMRSASVCSETEGRWWSIWRASLQNERWHLISPKERGKKRTWLLACMKVELIFIQIEFINQLQPMKSSSFYTQRYTWKGVKLDIRFGDIAEINIMMQRIFGDLDIQYVMISLMFAESHIKYSKN